MTTPSAQQHWTLGSCKKLPTAISSRINRLGELDDLRKRYLAAGNAAGLRRVAREYAALGMHAAAAEVRREAG